MQARLAPLPRGEAARVLHLTLPSSQANFVAPIAEMVDEPDLMQDFHVVEAGGEAVGFFKIDRDFSRRIPRLPAEAHALRGLLIGGQFQGQGYGAATLLALKPYIRMHYAIPELWLSVDKENSRAIALYHHHGWRDNGALHQGRVGLEQVMRLALE